MSRTFFLFAFSLFLFCSPATAASAEKKEVWTQCAPTREAALKELAEQIQITIQSDSHTRQSVRENDTSFLSGWFSAPEFSSEKTFESRQKVRLDLVNIKTVPSPDQKDAICLQVQRSDLIAYAASLLEQTRSYSPEKLPKDLKEKKRTLTAWIGDIETASNFATLFGAELREKKSHDRLLKQKKELTDLSATLFEQSVVIRSGLASAGLILNGKSAKIGEEIYLPPGTHHYRVNATGHCPVTGSFLLEDKKDQVLHVTPEPLPALTLTSNQPRASVTIDGAPWTAGKEKILDRCEGSVAYTVTLGEEKNQGSIALKPGLKAREKVYLYTNKEMDSLKTMAEVFTKGKSVELGYLFSTAGSDFKDLHNIHKVTLAGYKNFRFLRMGLGAAYGRADATEDSLTMEAYISFLFQLSALGAQERPLHFFGLFPIIPFAGLDIGAGYHDIHHEKLGKSIHNFPRPTSPDPEDNLRDHGLLRATGGLQIPINKHVGLKFLYGKNFYMEKASEFGASLVMNF